MHGLTGVSTAKGPLPLGKRDGLVLTRALLKGVGTACGHVRVRVLEAELRADRAVDKVVKGVEVLRPFVLAGQKGAFQNTTLVRDNALNQRTSHGLDAVAARSRKIVVVVDSPGP